MNYNQQMFASVKLFFEKPFADFSSKT